MAPVPSGGWSSRTRNVQCQSRVLPGGHSSSNGSALTAPPCLDTARGSVVPLPLPSTRLCSCTPVPCPSDTIFWWRFCAGFWAKLGEGLGRCSERRRHPAPARGCGWQPGPCRPCMGSRSTSSSELSAPSSTRRACTPHHPQKAAALVCPSGLVITGQAPGHLLRPPFPGCPPQHTLPSFHGSPREKGSTGLVRCTAERGPAVGRGPSILRRASGARHWGTAGQAAA